MEFIKKNSKWIILLGNVLTLIGLFLPFATVSSKVLDRAESIKFIEGDGVIVLIAIVISIVSTLLKKNKTSLSGLVFALAVTIYDTINVNKKFNELGYTKLVDLSFGVGFYLIIIGLVISIGIMILDKYVLNKDNVSGLNQQVNPTFNNTPEQTNMFVQSNPVEQPTQQFAQPTMSQQPTQTNNFIQPELQPNPVEPSTQQFIQPTMPNNIESQVQQPVQTNTFIQPELQPNPFTEQPTQNISNGFVTCPVCGITTSSDTQFCTRCGNSLK